MISEFIISNENTCLLLLKIYDVKYFERHYFAYKLEPKIDVYILVNVNDLVIHDCFEIQRNCNWDSLYLVLRHHL